MSGRRGALETSQSCSVVFPAGLFSLEKDEVYPYERFAYSLLDVAVEVLHHQNLPENISVEFARPAVAGSAWSINAAVSIDRDADGAPLKFRFGTSELFPAIAYLFVAHVTKGLLEEGGASYFIQNSYELRHRI